MAKSNIKNINNYLFFKKPTLNYNFEKSNKIYFYYFFFLKHWIHNLTQSIYYNHYKQCFINNSRVFINLRNKKKNFITKNKVNNLIYLPKYKKNVKANRLLNHNNEKKKQTLDYAPNNVTISKLNSNADNFFSIITSKHQIYSPKVSFVGNFDYFKDESFGFWKHNTSAMYKNFTSGRGYLRTQNETLASMSSAFFLPSDVKKKNNLIRPVFKERYLESHLVLNLNFFFLNENVTILYKIINSSNLINFLSRLIRKNRKNYTFIKPLLKLKQSIRSWFHGEFFYRTKYHRDFGKKTISSFWESKGYSNLIEGDEN